MKCFWCGKENSNLEMDYETKEIIKHFPCNQCNNQPERSKREDLICGYDVDGIKWNLPHYPAQDAVL